MDRAYRRMFPCAIVFSFFAFTAPVAGQWTSGGLADRSVTALASDPSSPSTIYAGTDRDGLFRTLDGGATWTALGLENQGSISAIALRPGSPAVYVGTSSGLFRGSADGSSWSSILPEATSAIAFDAVALNTLYEAGDGVQGSPNGGLSWYQSSLTRRVYAFLLDSLQPSTLYAGTDYTYEYTYPYGDYPPLTSTLHHGGGEIYVSHNGGASWEPTTPDLGQAVIAFAADTSGLPVYAATASRIFRSTDHGTTWDPVLGDGRPGTITTLLADPVRPRTLYAASYWVGASRSVDGGDHWSALNRGFTSLIGLTSLTIDPTGRYLRAGSRLHGVFVYDLGSPEGPCAHDETTLCLLGNRFSATLIAWDDASGRRRSGRAVESGDGFGSFSLPNLTGDPALPEVLVKMVDASALTPARFWVFYSGLTSLHYSLTVTDMQTGLQRVYESDGFCGGADTAAFPAEADGSAGSPIFAAAAAVADPAASDSLSLLSSRFVVTASAVDPRTGRTGNGSVLNQIDRFGCFSLPELTGSPDLPEVCVKMLDARGFDGSFWFFYAGLTDLSYSLTVRDSATGGIRTYGNGGGPGKFCGGADTSLGE